jgi:hypothetical protein
MRRRIGRTEDEVDGGTGEQDLQDAVLQVLPDHLPQRHRRRRLHEVAPEPAPK